MGVDITVNVDDMEKYITNAVNNNKEQLNQFLDLIDDLNGILTIGDFYNRANEDGTQMLFI